jgi:succinate-semialdehyde dehydrogenase / glutarate-semialdehyde dehydrogenase
VTERARVVYRAGDLMLERADELARLLTLEVGKLTAEAHGEAAWVAGILHYYGEKGPSFLEPEPLPVEEGEAVIVKAPLGVLLGIQPWKYPLYQVARFAGPNLVTGNTVLLKHSEVCPQTALALEQTVCRRRGTRGRLYERLLEHSRCGVGDCTPSRAGCFGDGQ